jgi:tripartite ATP-independent transporter DctP family solute receptor
MDHLRRSVIKYSALAIPTMFSSRALAQSAQYKLKFANNLPVSHPLNVRAKMMAAAIAADTGGRVDVQVFPSSQLGSDTDVLSQLRSGSVELFTLSGLILSTLVPAAAISGIGFAFADYPSVWKAMDGELGSYIRAQIEKANLVVFDKIWDNGFRQVTSSTKPILAAEDLRGLKIRVPVSPLWTSMFKAFGASPAAINFSEVYSALQTRIVDAEENPLAVIETTKLNEVQKFCSLTNHTWDGFWLLANRRSWEKIPEDLRSIITKHASGFALQERSDLATLNATVQTELTSKGLIFNTTKPDSFRQALQQAGFYADWKSKFGDAAWSTLERNSGKLS